jgi:CheY-like chemotaxis protein
MKILIVDDNPRSRKMIRKYLRASNAEIAEREDGSEALSAYYEFSPHWVLMDWEMKKVGGLEATREITQRFPQAQILIVTNYDEKDLRQAAFEAGAKGYILKDDLTPLNSFLFSET